MQKQHIAINDFFNTYYKMYAKYTVEERALPSIIDGFKPGARKIVHAALSTLSSTKEQKLLNLVGSTYSLSAYHHGNVSLEDTIIKLGRQFSFTYAPLEIVGSGGSLRSLSAASARYLDVKLAKAAKLLEQDSELLDYNTDAGQKIEPTHYLPLLPLALFNRTVGLALGYSYGNHVSYNPHCIIDAVIECISNQNKLPTACLEPWVAQFDGSFEATKYEGKYDSVGKYIANQTNGKVIIQELAHDVTYKDIEELLNKYQDEGYIRKWANERDKNDRMQYSVYFDKSILTDWIKRNRLEAKLLIRTRNKSATYTMLDEHGKVIQFNTAAEIIRYFTKYRVSKYVELKALKIKKLEEKIAYYQMIMLFIELYLAGTIKLDKDTPMDKTKAILDKHEISHSVLDMKIRKLSKEEYDKLASELKSMLERLEYLKTTSPEQLYINDLEDLRLYFKDDYPSQMKNNG